MDTRFVDATNVVLSVMEGQHKARPLPAEVLDALRLLRLVAQNEEDHAAIQDDMHETVKLLREEQVGLRAELRKLMRENVAFAHEVEEERQSGRRRVGVGVESVFEILERLTGPSAPTPIYELERRAATGEPGATEALEKARARLAHLTAKLPRGNPGESAS